MQIKDLDDLKEQIKSYLPEYLENFGRRINRGNFSCPNESAHQNQQKEPTAGFPNKHDKTIWNCFGCGAKGDIFHAAYYLEGRDLNGQGFIETLTHLADMFGVSYEVDERLEDILRLHEHLTKTIRIRPESTKAIEYLKQRNLLNAVSTFELGYCTWDGLKKNLIKQFDLETVNVQLDPKVFDDRLVIPIRNENGKLVGFAGRTMGDQIPKYINSRSSQMYQKKKLLYNLHNIKGDLVYVVEGYADVWRLHINNYPAVAPCGTAFTTEHLNLLHERGIKKVTFCFDGDKAGLEAQEKIRKLVAHDSRFELSFMTLPKGKDPDEIINEQGTDAFDKAETEIIKRPIDSLLTWTTQKILDLETKLDEGEEDGYKVEWELFMNSMEGVKKGLHLVGGLSNVGKTSFMLQIYRQLALNNSNLIPIFFSIDDDWQVPYLRLIASQMKMSMGNVRNYKKVYESLVKTNSFAADKFFQDRIRVAGEVYKMVQNAPIFDITKASKLHEFEEIIKTVKEYTGREVAIFIDNFHKIRDDGFSNTNERFTRISEELKKITVEQELVTFATVELRKLNHSGRPTLDDIKESVDIIYDSNVVYMLHNDLHSKQGKTDLKFEMSGKQYPVIEMSVQKNKLSAFKGKIYFRFIPEQAYFFECVPGEQEEFSKVEITRGSS